MKTRHIAIISTQSETQISFGTNSVLFHQKEAILGRFEASCLPGYIQLAPRFWLTGHAFNMDADSFASHARGGGRGSNLPRSWVCALVEPKSGPITRARFFIEKTPKTCKNDNNLLVSLNPSYNLCKHFKFYSLQGQNI